MSHTRLPYDPCAYRADLLQSLGPGYYMIDTPQASRCGACFVQDPVLRLGSGPALACKYSGALVDTDSELMGLTRVATKCPVSRPPDTSRLTCAMRDCQPGIREFLGAEDTRISNPPCTMRSRGINRWEWLCRDPQQLVLPLFDYNVNYRLVAKDNHRPCVTDPMPQHTGLPPPDAPRPRELDDWACACDTNDPPNGIPSVTWPACSRFY
jgi:hypothetical protein